MGLMHLKSHYKVDLLLELDNFKDVVEDCSKNVHFLNNKSRRTFVVFFIMNSLSEDPNIYSFTNYKSVLPSLLSMKVTFKTIVYICDHKLFNNLVVSFQILLNFQAGNSFCEVIKLMDELATFDLCLPFSS
jgi:hypothetical protein